MKPYSYVSCRVCMVTLARPSEQCPAYDRPAPKDEPIQLRQGGTSCIFAGCRRFLITLRDQLRSWRSCRDVEEGRRVPGTNHLYHHTLMLCITHDQTSDVFCASTSTARGPRPVYLAAGRCTTKANGSWQRLTCHIGGRIAHASLP
jgi:hypothetical protein